MPMKSNKLFVATLSLAVFPWAVMAQTSTGTTANFCTRLTSLQAVMDSRMSTRMSDLTTHQTQVLADIQTRRSSIDDQLSADRSQWAADRQKEFAALQDNATTDAQKAAVQTFITGLTNAIATREAAVDAAKKSFRNGVDADITAHQKAMMDAITAFQDAKMAAFQKAQSDCSSGVAPATARATFKAAMQTAAQALQTNHQNVDKLGPQISALAKTRNTAVQTALTNFKNTAEQLRTALKAALNPSTVPTSTSTTNSTSTNQ